MNQEKYFFHWEKKNFEPIGNSAYKVGFLALGKALNICVDYLIFYPQHVK